MKRVLLWDHDGVLVDTEGLYHQATRETLVQIGVQLDDELYRQHVLVQGTGVWHLAGNRTAAELAQLRLHRDARYTELITRGDVYIPGALEMVAELAPRHRMAIVTSSQRVHFDAIHRGRSLPSYFELVLAREDYVASKPDPEPYLTALARLDVDRSACLVIEDSERGLRAAHAAGLTCWVIPSSLTAASDFSCAARRFDDISSLHAALRNEL